MTRLAVVLICSLAAAGCASILPLAGGFGAGAVAFKQDADQVLALDKPLKDIGCDIELTKPHGPVFSAALGTYCANVPTSVAAATVTWLKVFAAIEAAENP